ncbi:hypothetical protein HYX14_02260 [Candidatus Woesearchaeota archaeon]|nr:hypothetical protein [Candidatus Woesearchaeota archaeon]
MKEPCDTCDRTPVPQRIQEFVSDRAKFHLEWQMLQYMGLTFLLLLLLAAVLYVAVWKDLPRFWTKQGIWILYLIITVVFTGGAIWHLKAYRAKIDSMTGMMIGMTVGMQTGMMLSVIIGSTNGMFMGGLLGMVFAVAMGVYTGKCCGIMGILQGAMAGVMGGTMGPMIALMMRNDHILWFMPPFMIINVLILLGMSYMLYEEVVEKTEKIEKTPMDFGTFFSYCLIVTIVFGLVISFGYKSAFVA